MGSSCCKPRAADSLSGSGTNQRWRASSSLSLSNNSGYTTHSDLSTTPAGVDVIINPRASELGRVAGYALESYVSSSSRPAASRSNRFNDLWLNAGYTLPPYVSSSSPPPTTPARAKPMNLAAEALAAHTPAAPAPPPRHSHLWSSSVSI